MIAVIGGGLAGLAAAARLAKVGHQIVLLERRPGIDAGIEVATEPGGRVITLPAAWRDLFRKSGRILDAELARRGLALAPAPPRRYRLTGGATLDLPTGRGEQWAVLSATLGEPAAIAWRDLLDRLDDTWQQLRGLGLEAEFTGRDQLTAAVRADLRPRESLRTLAGGLPSAELTEVVLEVATRLGQDPARLPGWHAFRLATERTFGRWLLVDADGEPQPAARLVEVLLDRLATRGVEVRTGVSVSRIRGDLGGFHLDTTAGVVPAELVISTVAPSVHAGLTRDRSDQRIARRLRPAPGGGATWTSWRTLLDLPPLQSLRPGVLVTSAWSPAGPDSWAQLLTGALAAYRAHAELTGEDIRPTNRDYRPR